MAHPEKVFVENPVHHARVDMVGLLVACPYNQDNPANCPLHYIRQRDMAQRIAWLDSLDEEEVQVLYANHQHCLEIKEHRSPHRHS